MTTTEYQERTWSFGRCDDYPDGPWKTEPDKVQWVDTATGLDCLILRNHSGALCGYVGIPKAHPWHGKGYGSCLEGCDDTWCYDHSPEGRIRVHGGLTFADRCAEGRGDDAICHVPYEGREDGIWWFGFDTAHCGDLCPAYGFERRFSFPGTYRDVAYVKAECVSLASQLQAIRMTALAERHLTAVPDAPTPLRTVAYEMWLAQRVQDYAERCHDQNPWIVAQECAAMVVGRPVDVTVLVALADAIADAAKAEDNTELSQRLDVVDGLTRQIVGA